jgi:hypothetical protein
MLQKIIYIAARILPRPLGATWGTVDGDIDGPGRSLTLERINYEANILPPLITTLVSGLDEKYFSSHRITALMYLFSM